MKHRSKLFSVMPVFLAACLTTPTAFGQSSAVQADLLIVGGTESGCAAAVQAAQMGVKRIILVNDIDWLGGQFSAEALVAIDENTDKTGVRHEPPIPRHGAFREVIDLIEQNNLEKYGVARPGNTRVITTTKPADAAAAFRRWLQPYIDSDQITIFNRFEPQSVTTENDRVVAVQFVDPQAPDRTLEVAATLTIDASDWGDVVRLSGAAYEFGPDLKHKYGEPLAPEQRDGYPLTDMNPITWCVVIEESGDGQPIDMPPGYDAENYRHHRWPKDPLWLYGTRRVIDHYHFDQIQHPDVLLLCFPAIDYPLDEYPGPVARALEESEPGSSKKNIVELSPAQRQIIFQDAKNYSLGFLYYLQTEVHDQMPDQTHSYRRFRLVDDFGTSDRLPFKPYIRESRRTKAMYMMRQQDTMGLQNDSANFAKAMYHDSVAVWQFEYDFHPTKREFLKDGDIDGPWRCGFREGRTWGPPYSGRSTLPLRSLIPETMDGLLLGQKNLGYSSIVSSAVRLHDASMAVGQAVGACAAYSILNDVEPRSIPFDRAHLINVQQSIVRRSADAEPGMLWPWRDVDSSVPQYAAIQMLSALRCLPVMGDEPNFRPHEPATDAWVQAVRERTRQQLQADESIPQVDDKALTRAEFAEQWWQQVRRRKWQPYHRVNSQDFDGDGIPDVDDALPVDPTNASLTLSPPRPEADGIPDPPTATLKLVRAINFGSNADTDSGWHADSGEPFDASRGYGWNSDLSMQIRNRSTTGPEREQPAASFVFTRTHHKWQMKLPNGRYLVELCIGDLSHDQAGQHVSIQQQSALSDVSTSAGKFLEVRQPVEIQDGQLTIEIGRPGSTTNTCLNWLRIFKHDSQNN